MGWLRNWRGAMTGIVIFHVLTFLLSLGIASRTIPSPFVSKMLNYLHQSIGITMPAPEQVRTVALIWIGSVLIIADGCLFLLVLIASSSNSG